MKHFKCDLSVQTVFGAAERIQTRATPPAREVECARVDSARGGSEGCRALRVLVRPNCVADVPFSGSAGCAQRGTVTVHPGTSWVVMNIRMP